jgi:hypothetical protein
MTAGPIGYVFGYATIADASDDLVVRSASALPPVYGHVRGYRRVWDAAVENLAATTDHKHYIDPVTRERPDVAVVTLNMEPDETISVNGIAVPVDEASLALFDRREHFLHRIEVRDRFTGTRDLPVWAYTATAESLALYRSARAGGRAVIRRSYYDRVLRTFHDLGPEAWADFERSTCPPECAIADLIVVRAPGDQGV